MYFVKSFLITVLALAMYCMSASAQSCGGITITADTIKGCPGLLVKFSAIGAPAGSIYDWNFGSGFVTANDTTYKIYTVPGKHGVQLRIQLPGGGLCNLALKDSIEILQAPVTQIAVSPGKVICNGNKKVTFTDNTTGVVYREWIIDGVKYTNSKQVTHTFSSIGNKSVSLKVTNAFGCTTIFSDNKFVQIYDSAEVDFCANITQTRTGTKARFSPYFVGGGRNAATYSWSFPGGSPSSYIGKLPPEISYSNPAGVYAVSLTITTADGCSYTSYRPSVIQPFIVWPKDTICINEVLNVTFKGGGSGRGFITFNFPGSVPIGLSPMPVVYKSGGAFSYNFSYKYKQTGCVSNVTLPDYIYVRGPMASFFSIDPNRCSIKDSVRFENTSLAYGAPNVTYQWRIFDSLGNPVPGTPIGPTATKNMAFLFKKNGVYDVRLIAKSSNGCSDSITREKYISIRQPHADFKLDTNKYCLGKSIGFINLTTPKDDPNNPFDYNWIVQHADSTPILAVINAKQPTDFIPPALGKYHVTLIASSSKTCSDTIKKMYAFEVMGVKGDFIVNKTSGCAPNSLRASLDYSKFKKYPNTPFNVLKYKWEVVPDQGVFITQPDREYTDIYFTNPGCYKLYLNVYDNEACTSQFVKKGNTICLGVKSIFEVDSSQCLGAPSQLINLSEMDPDKYQWLAEPAAFAKFSPSDTSANATVTFLKDTCYTLKLIAFKGGCRDTATRNICVQVPKADFTTPPVQYQCAPVIVSFDNISKNSQDYIWDFGDGNIVRSTNSKVYHVYQYNNPDGFRVKLTAIDTLKNCTDTISKKSYIKVIGPAPRFTVDQRVGCDSLTVAFTDKSINVKSFLLDYDDGSPFSTDSISSHKYVIDNSTSDSMVFYPVMIDPDTSVCKKVPYWRDTIIIYRSAKANFTADVQTGCPPLTVNFQDLSSNAKIRYWDLNGDSLIDDSSQNPVFVYDKPGTYTVTEYVENAAQCLNKLEKKAYINVLPIPEAAFSMDKKKLCGSGKVVFSNKSKNYTYSTIDYGDGSPKDSVIFKPHTYTFDPNSAFDSVAFFPVIKSYNADCFTSDTDTVVVYRTPIAGFTADTLYGCEPLTVKFKDTSKSSIARQWDFNNDGIVDDSVINPVYSFNAGKYSVKLTAINAAACKDVVIKTDLIDVNPLPKVDFEVSDSIICVKEQVSFTDKSTSPAGIVKWLWKFDEPNTATDTSSEQNPSFSYYTAGYRNISLTVWDLKGCSQTKTFKAVFVEDSLAPVNTALRYVTVVDSEVIAVSWDKSNISDFQEYKLRRSGNPDVLVYSSDKINVNGFVESGTGINANSQSYCYDIQTTDRCGNISDRSISHCTIFLQANPSGWASNKLDWTPYIGWASVKQYNIYRFEQGQIPVKIATVPGQELTYLDTGLCNLDYYYYIEAINAANTNIISQSNKDVSKPNYQLQDSPIRLNYTTVKDDNSLEINWNTGNQPNIRQYLVDKNDPDKGLLENYLTTQNTSFTDNNVSPSLQSYTYRVKVEDKCGNISMLSNPGKSVLLQNYVQDDKVFLFWTRYQTWPEGIKNYIVQVRRRDKQFDTVAVVNSNDSFYIADTSFSQIDTAYCFRVIAVSAAQPADFSVSNISCALLPSRLYLPNAFTPNGEGNTKNEIWKPAALSIYNKTGKDIIEYNLRIYDRWGSLVFETSDLNEGWDGKQNGKRLPEGVYIYMIKAEGIDKTSFNLKGNITLLR